MTQYRKVRPCINCGDTREIAAHGLCFACYRREERVKRSDPHAAAGNNKRKQQFRAFNNVMAGLCELGVGKAEMMQIRNLIDPYLNDISDYLQKPVVVLDGPQPSGGSVNSEHEPGSEHSQDEPLEMSIVRWSA